MHVAEKPNPLKPLIIDAMNTVKIISRILNKLNSKKFNKLIKTCTYQPCTLPKLLLHLILYISLSYFISIFSGSMPFGLYLIIKSKPNPIIKNLK